jgi:hypothetical protein
LQATAAELSDERAEHFGSGTTVDIPPARTIADRLGVDGEALWGLVVGQGLCAWMIQVADW